MTHPNRRVLFALANPGTSRMSAPPTAKMAVPGWTVPIASDKPHKRSGAALVPSGAGHGVRSLGALPGSVAPAPRTLRAGLDYLRYLEPSFAHADFLRRRIEKRLPRSLAFLTRLEGIPRWLF